MMKIVSVMTILIVVVAFAFCSCSKEGTDTSQTQTQGGSMSTGGGDPQAMAVKVNDKIITNKDVAEEENRLLQQLAGQVDPSQLGQMRELVHKQAVNNMVDRELLRQAVENESITVDQSEVDARIAEITERFGSREALSERLEMIGMTEEAFLQEMETSLKMEKLLAEHSDVKPVTEEEARAYYEQNIDRFKQPERIRASHILIQVKPEDSEAEKKMKRQEAERLLGEIRNGADFTQLAAQYSDCPSKQRGGDLGYFGRGQMVKPFEDAAFALKPGEVSGIVETQFGYHIIKVTERQEARTVPFEETKEGLINYLEGQRKQQAMQSYVEQLRQAATIEYPDSGSAQQ